MSLALEAIIERMQGLTEHDYPRHNVWVLIRRLRGKIAPIGLAIESSQGRFRGGDCAYRLVRRGSPPQ